MAHRIVGNVVSNRPAAVRHAAAVNPPAAPSRPAVAAPAAPSPGTPEAAPAAARSGRRAARARAAARPVAERLRAEEIRAAIAHTVAIGHATDPALPGRTTTPAPTARAVAARPPVADTTHAEETAGPTGTRAVRAAASGIAAAAGVAAIVIAVPTVREVGRPVVEQARASASGLAATAPTAPGATGIAAWTVGRGMLARTGIEAGALVLPGRVARPPVASAVRARVAVRATITSVAVAAGSVAGVRSLRPPRPVPRHPPASRRSPSRSASWSPARC